MRFDMIIVGGGLVGASLALALRELPLSIALIDAKLPSSSDPRLFGLNVSSCQLLENLNLWSQVAQYASPIEAVHVSHRGHFGGVRLQAKEAQLKNLGHVLPAQHLEKALHEAVGALKNVTVLRPANVTGLTHQGETTTLTYTQGDETHTLTASVIIGADGTESSLRALCDIPTTLKDYAQTAIVTRVLLSRPHRNIAYERFCDDGAIALLPLPNNECACIWSVNNVRATELAAMSDAAYLKTLQTTFGYRLGRLTGITQRYQFPLKMKRATQSVAGNVILLGNALHTLHPIAAQGFNLALYEVAALAEGIANAFAQSTPINIHLLQSLSEETQRQQKASLTVSDGLAQLFKTGKHVANDFIGIGMTGFDCLPPLKKHFIDQMTGRAGFTPALLTGN